MTFPPFSYNVSKTIIGHLDLEKRMQIFNSCPNLKTAERKSVLQIDSLGINRSFFYVHNLVFIYSKFEDRARIIFTRTNSRRERWFPRVFPKNYDGLWKKLVDVYLADRGTITVKRLKCKYDVKQLSKFPETLKIQCQELSLAFYQLETMQAVSRFLITPFPEKISFTLDITEELLYEHELVRNAKFLVITLQLDSDKNVNQLIQLTNREIHVKTDRVQLEPQNVLKMAKNWLARCPQPDVGTRFTMVVRKYEYVLDVMNVMRDELEAVQGEIIDENSRESTLRNCVTIQMRSGDELNIFGGTNIEKKKNEKKKERWLFTMKVMEKGSSRIIEEISSVSRS